MPFVGTLSLGVPVPIGAVTLEAQVPPSDTVRPPRADSGARGLPPAAADSEARASAAAASVGQDLIYGGQFEAAALYFGDLAQRYPHDPTGPVLAASALIWWAEARDDDAFRQDSIDVLLTEGAARARGGIAAATTDSERVAALFWAGTAFGYRARQADLHGHYWKAVGDAKRMRAALDSALTIDSTCVDCRLGLAIYDYALARAGVLTRLVAHLVGLGGGNATAAIEAMRLVSEHGSVARLEARWLYASALLREGKPGDPRRQQARQIISDLAVRFPGNPVFQRFLDRPATAP